jgi:hypothetical protein
VIDKHHLIGELVKRLAALPVGDCLDVRSFKRDRSLLLARTGEAAYEIHEDGFTARHHCVPADELKKRLKAIVAHEFPRSHKLRLYNLGAFGADTAALRRKVI